jgi:amino acid transporter
MNPEKSFAKRLPVWFSIGALIFATFCGANMASGVYASAYIVTLGGGWALVWLLMFFTFMSFFCTLGLNFIRAFKVDNYNSYYLTLYGLHKPEAKPILKAAVSVFFDILSLLVGLITVGATIALFSEMLNSLLDIPAIICSTGIILLFAVLTIFGAGFLRKFNTIVTVILFVSLTAILAAVIAVRGDVLANRIGNFNEGPEWGGTTVVVHFTMMFFYCMTNSGWGATLCNYSEHIKDQKDAVGAGITIGALVTVLFAMTGAIVLPFMPEMLIGTPILLICQQYLPSVLTGVYWFVIFFSVVSTAPVFTFNIANRFSRLWKNEKISKKTKFFVISMTFLLLCQLVSRVGLMTIVQKGYIRLGNVALFAVVAPLLISIYRVWKKDQAEKTTPPYKANCTRSAFAE